MEPIDDIVEKIQLNLADFAYDNDVMVEEKYRLARIVCQRIYLLQGIIDNINAMYPRSEPQDKIDEIVRINTEIKELLEGNIDSI